MINKGIIIYLFYYNWVSWSLGVYNNGNKGLGGRITNVEVKFTEYYKVKNGISLNIALVSLRFLFIPVLLLNISLQLVLFQSLYWSNNWRWPVMSISVVDILQSKPTNTTHPADYLRWRARGGNYLHALTHFYLDTRCRKLAISPDNQIMRWEFTCVKYQGRANCQSFKCSFHPIYPKSIVVEHDSNF